MNSREALFPNFSFNDEFLGNVLFCVSNSNSMDSSVQQQTYDFLQKYSDSSTFCVYLLYILHNQSYPNSSRCVSCNLLRRNLSSEKHYPAFFQDSVIKIIFSVLNNEKTDFVCSLAALLAKCVSVFRIKGNSMLNMEEIFVQIQDPLIRLEIVSEMELRNFDFECEAYRFCAEIFKEDPCLYHTIFRILGSFEHLCQFQQQIFGDFILPSLSDIKECDEYFIAEVLDLICTVLCSNEDDSTDLVLPVIGHVIQFINSDNELLSVPAASVFENNINFQNSYNELKNVVEALVSRLDSDKDISIYGISQQCIFSLQSICKSYGDEIVPFLYQQIQQNTSITFRLISAISLSLDGEQYIHCFDFVMQSLKSINDPVLLNEITNAFSNLIQNPFIKGIPTIIDDLFPYIYSENYFIKTQIKQILLCCFSQQEYTCKPEFIDSISKAINLTDISEIDEIFDFVFWFLYFCESFDECSNFEDFFKYHYNNFIASDNIQNVMLSLKVISGCVPKVSIQINDIFLQRLFSSFQEDKTYISYSINILSIILQTDPNNELISEILSYIPQTIISCDSSLKISVLAFIGDLFSLNTEKFALISDQLIDSLLTPGLFSDDDLGNVSFCVYYSLRFCNKKLIDFQNIQIFYKTLTYYIFNYNDEINPDLQNIALCAFKILIMFSDSLECSPELNSMLNQVINTIEDKKIIYDDQQITNFFAKNNQKLC